MAIKKKEPAPLGRRRMNADFLGLVALHTLWVGAGVAALAFVAP